MNRIKPALLNLDARRNSKEILKEIPLREGQVVADLGSGGGYFTLAFAEKVGTEGRVYAVDTDSKNLIFIGDKTKQRGFTDRVILTLSEPDCFILAAESCNLVFSRNSFHHIEYPEIYFKRVAAALRPEGILIIIDYDGTGFFPHKSHCSAPEAIRESLSKAGFRLSRSIDCLSGQSFQIFNVN